MLRPRRSSVGSSGNTSNADWDAHGMRRTIPPKRWHRRPETLMSAKTNDIPSSTASLADETAPMTMAGLAWRSWASVQQIMSTCRCCVGPRRLPHGRCLPKPPPGCAGRATVRRSPLVASPSWVQRVAPQLCELLERELGYSVTPSSSVVSVRQSHLESAQSLRDDVHPNYG